MQIWNTAERYGSVAKLLHWGIGIAIIGMLAVGIYMEGLPSSADKFQLYGLHKSTGMVILFFVALRILWRWGNVIPQIPSEHPKLVKLGGKLAHFALYGLMIAMPMTGWVMSSAGGYKVSIYGWVTVPPIVEKNPDLGKLANATHEYLGYVLIAIVVAHIIAALVHHFKFKDNVLRRMLPFVK